MVFVQHGNDGRQHEIFIDDIELAKEYGNARVPGQPQLLDAKGYARHVDIRWSARPGVAAKYVKIYRSEDNRHFIPVGIQWPQYNRYADYTGVEGKTFYYKATYVDSSYNETEFSNIVSASTRAMSDEELLTMVQEANFRYYWEQCEPTSGLAARKSARPP